MATATKTAAKHGGARKGAGRKPDVVEKAVLEAADFIDYGAARAKKEHWDAQLKEQEYRKRAGELLDRAQVETASATVLATVAQTLRSIPDNLEAAAGLTTAQALECERIIDSLCVGLHDKLKELGGW